MNRRRAGEDVRRARHAVFVAFGGAGVATASWASRLPDIVQSLDLTPGALGRLLLLVSLGAIVSLASTGRLVGRWGTARTVGGAAALCGTGLLLAGLAAGAAQSYAGTALSLVVVGLGMGAWDAGMNTEGALVEARGERAIMPWFHALFSGGTVAAALVGAVMTAVGCPLWLHMLLPAGVGYLVALRTVRDFLPAASAWPARVEAAEAGGASAAGGASVPAGPGEGEAVVAGEPAAQPAAAEEPAVVRAAA
ncbi:MAG: hypothetical protein LBH76_01480, partial [Propionibacteriaceae bacterium]|nr:hypothetical protein [Propionibacteriaceae bacterium]